MGRDWDRRRGETSRAYAAFRVYLEMDPLKRSVPRAYSESTGKPYVAKKTNHWGRWCARWDWVKRAAAFDKWDLERRMEARLDTIERARQKLYDKAPEAVDELIKAVLGDQVTDRVKATLLKDFLDRVGLTPPREPASVDIDAGPAVVRVHIGRQTMEGVQDDDEEDGDAQ